MSFEKKLGKSALDFKTIVYPKIKNWFGGGDLIPIEGTTEKTLAELLDQNSGIDAWYIETNKGIRGVASRIQWKDKAKNPKNFPYNTFSVRYEKYNDVRTEFEKLSHAIKEDWIYPYWFVQAYLTCHQGELLSVARCETKTLINLLKTNPNKYRLIDNYKDAYFKAVPWNDFENHDLYINIKTEQQISPKKKPLEAFFNA